LHRPNRKVNEVGSANRLILSILVVAALAVAFWALALGPKREEASKLSGEVDALNVSVAESRSRLNEAVQARREFPADYRQLVVLGKAVPASDDTSTLLVELSGIAKRSRIEFDSIQLGAGSGEETVAPVPAPAPVAPTAPAAPSGSVPASASVPPTEAEASLLPLGATIGSAGLGVMPYDLTFTGNFFHIADFIKGIDSLIHTGDRDVDVNGRLVTLDGFALSADTQVGFPLLDATFSVTTYLTPPDQGATAGATSTAPAPATAAPAATESTESEPEPTPVSAAQ
jgi:Tfp pilus assembly protein PilO